MKNSNLPEQEISKHKESQIVKLYEDREKITLNKYQITKDEFKTALEKTFSKDKQIQSYNEEIESLLIDATLGKSPQIVVPENLKKNINKDAAL